MARCSGTLKTWKPPSPDVKSCNYNRPAAAELASLAQSQPSNHSVDVGRRSQQVTYRWGNSLAVRLPAESLRQAGLMGGDQIEIVVGSDGRLSLEPVQRPDRFALVADLRQLQTTLPLTPSVIEACRISERW